MNDSCVFCKIVKGEVPSKKVYEDDVVIVIMDIDPFCDGHVLIIPKEHYTDMMDLPQEVLTHINNKAKELTKQIMEKLDKPGMTISYNYGNKQAVKHFHLHLLPDISQKASESVDNIYQKIMQ